MSITVGVGLSLQKNPILAVNEALRLAGLSIDYQKIDLVLVFSSTNLAYPSLLKTLSASLEDVPIIGCSGAAIICNQGIFKEGLVVMLISLPTEMHIHTACVKDIKSKTPAGAGKELGEELLFGSKNMRRALSVIFSDGLMDEGSKMLYGLQESLGKSFPLFGASASDNLRFQKTYLYYNQELLPDSAAGILWGGKMNFGLGIKHGWKPLGKPRTVTKSQGNIVYEIDGQAAVKIYEEYFACDVAKLQKELRYISVLYPIGMYLSAEEEYLLRNILSINADGSIRFQGNVNEGSQIRLMIGTKESCLAATHQAIEEVKKGLFGPLYDKNSMNYFALIFESVSRYNILKRDTTKELEIIKDGLGRNTPIIGLYTYGEQAPLRAADYQGRSYLHNQTITVVGLGA